jgi:surface protein
MEEEIQSLSFVNKITNTINYEEDQKELIEKAKAISNGDPLDALKYIVISLTHDNINNIEFELVVAIPDEKLIELPIIVDKANIGLGYYVSWGDGDITHNLSMHLYKKPKNIALYNIRIFGFCITGFGHNIQGMVYPYNVIERTESIHNFQESLLRVLSFGNLGHKFTSLRGAFMDCYKLHDIPKNIPSSITNIGFMFKSCASFNCELNTWDTSNITDMDGLLYECRTFNKPLDAWNTSSVKNMYHMFNDCFAFNQPVNTWNTSSVVIMEGVFFGCSSFNQPLDKWDTSLVTDMSRMFARCKQFNQSIDKWNVQNVTTMNFMFYACEMFDQPLDSWNTESLRTMEWMFNGCRNFNKPLNSWTIARVENFNRAFMACYKFNQPLNNWNLRWPNIDTYKMFENCGISKANMPLMD